MFKVFNNLYRKIEKIIDIGTILLTSSYYIIKYKIDLDTLSNTVINICNLVVYKNYLFIKIIQWGIQDFKYANNNGIMDIELQNYFKKFSNNVPYDSSELNHSKIILNEIMEYAKSQNDELIIENDCIPINSGTVAIIFKGKLNNNSVIIKILRHNIEKKIHCDILKVVHFIDNAFVDKIIKYYDLKINFKKIIMNNYDSLISQCDFNKEANNCLLFGKNLKNKKNIVIPQIYKKFTDFSNKIIVLEYLDGCIAKYANPDDLPKYATTISMFFYESLFMFNIMHGDFHFGNIMLMNDDKLGILDFGITYIVAKNISDAIFNLFIALVNSKTNQAVQIMVKLLSSNNHDYHLITNFIKNDDKIINIMKSKEFSANNSLYLIKRIIAIDKINFDPQISNLLLCVMSTIETIENVNKDTTLEKTFRLYINRAIQY